MSEPSRIEALRRHIQPRWDPEREAELGLRVKKRRTTLRRRRIVAGGAAAALAVAAAAILWPAPPPLTTEGADGAVLFADGTRIKPHSATSRVLVADVSPRRAEVLLREGGARFEVSRNPERVFVVRCGSVEVEVLGTEFDVTRQPHRVAVEVHHGQVRVRYPGGQALLSGGESDVFPPEDSAVRRAPTVMAFIDRDEPIDIEEPVTDEPEPADRTPSTMERSGRDEPRGDSEALRPSAMVRWQELASDGHYAAAVAELEAGAEVEDRVDELLLAADAARLSGHSARARRYLRRVVEQHASDPRSALAAFTLGRIDARRGAPADAARWFATARRRAGSGSIAEHALAREVEALAAAGDGRARARAEEYLRRYPSGPRADAMRRVTE
ncbi:MAG: FecR domain-containing protein [Myxococcota bacterium]